MSEKVPSESTYSLRDVPSKLRTGIGTAILGPLAFYVATELEKNTPLNLSQIGLSQYTIPNIPPEYSMLMLLPLVLYSADKVGGIVAAYIPPIINTMETVLNSMSAALLRYEPENWKNIVNKFNIANARIRNSWYDMVSGSFDDAFGGIILSLVGAITGYTTKVMDLPWFYMLPTLFLIGITSDVVGDFSKKILYYSGYSLQKLAEWLQGRSKQTRYKRQLSNVADARDDSDLSERNIECVVRAIERHVISLDELNPELRSSVEERLGEKNKTS